MKLLGIAGYEFNNDDFDISTLRIRIDFRGNGLETLEEQKELLEFIHNHIDSKLEKEHEEREKLRKQKDKEAGYHVE
ncbi:hypothetical protein [Bacillus haynesii]|uniref:hypothetical protein n=1 Tax=Bacillus haynesii TaxID=1925021 RepID=UPI002DB783FA|nr:hypothetical protein [Bacillus haynesii]MEC1479240.1 hypothetical protein [Bacillus haynesii]